MANKTASIVVRIDPEIKSKAEALMKNAGVTPSGLINALYRQIIIQGRVPFDIDFVEIRLDHLSDDEMRRRIKQADRDFAEGRYYTQEEADELVFGDRKKKSRGTKRRSRSSFSSVTRHPLRPLPVPFPHQVHRRGHHVRPHHEGVHEDGEHQREAELLQHRRR